MSITRTREFIEKTGCGHIVGIAIAVALGIGIIQGTCMNRGPANNAAAEEQQKNAPAAIKLHDVEVSGVAIQTAYENYLRQMREQSQTPDEPLEPTMTAQIYAQVVNQMIQSAALEHLARKAGFDFTQEKVIAQLQSFLRRNIQDQKAEYIKIGKLKAGATEQQFIDVYKKEVGRTPDEMLLEQTNQIKTNWERPDAKRDLSMFAAGDYLAGIESAKLKLSDADLTTLYTKYTMQSIFIASDPNVKEEPAARAAKALDELKKGAKWEAVFTKYSPKGMKPEDSKNDFPGTSLFTNEALKPLLKLKGGELSGVITQGGASSIFKMISMKTEYPADFNANKEKYRMEQTRMLVTQKIQEELNKIVQDKSAVTWSSEGLKLLHEATSSPVMFLPPAEQEAKVQAASAIATKNDSPDRMPASYAYYILADGMRGNPDPKVKEKGEATYLEAARNLLQLTESATLRLELVQLLLKKKDPTAGEELLKAAEVNQSFGNQGQSNHQAIYTRMDELKKAKLLSPELEKAINDAQARWKAAKKERDEAIAAQEKQMKEEQARAAKERAEAEAKLKKEREEAAKKPAAPSSSDLTGTGSNTP